MILLLISVCLTALAAAIVATLLMRAIAPACGLVDRPDAQRKLHYRATPLGGGLAVLTATLVAVFVGVLLSQWYQNWLPSDVSGLAGLFAAAACITAVGLIDDAYALRGRQKLVGQLIAVTVVIVSGLSIRSIALFGWQIDLGPLAIPFTYFWLLGAINALNLLDGTDGLATTIGLIASASISGMALASGHPVEAMIAAALACALVGFLIFNFPPASIFLGDAGSMLIGLVLGVLAIRSTLKGPATVALAAPAALMAIPILDSAAAIVRRSLTGRSIYTTDRGHLHHMMLRRGLTARSVLMWIALLCALTALGALVSVYLHNESLALITAAGVIGMLVASKVFGFKEIVLLGNRMLQFGGSLLPRRRGVTTVRQEIVRLQGSRNWELLWNALTEFAELHQLSSVRLELNLAWLHECFHATWHRPVEEEPDEMWATELPLIAHGRIMGRLNVGGPVTRDSVYELLNLLAELLESLEPCIYRLAAELPEEEVELLTVHSEEPALSEPVLFKHPVRLRIAP